MITAFEERYVWPAWPTVRILTGHKKEIVISKDRRFDLVDSLMTFRPGQRTFLFCLSTRSRKWARWNDRTLKEIEWRIRYDLNFDGYSATVKRVAGEGLPCTGEAVWKVVARPLH